MTKVTQVARAHRAGWLFAAVILGLGPLACGSPEESHKASRASRDAEESDEEEPAKVDVSSRRGTAGPLSVTGSPGGGRPLPIVSSPSVPVDAAPPSFKLDRLEVAAADAVTVSFSAPLVPPAGQQYWIALVKPDAPDGEFGAWHYVASGATSDTIKPASAGEYEIRLHDLYPKYKQGRVIARQRIKVTAAVKPVSGPFVPATGFCSADSDCPASHFCGQQGNCFPRERPKAQSCPLGKSYWGPCERTGCQAGYACSDRDNGGDGNCYCKS